MGKTNQLELSIKIAGKMDKSLMSAITGTKNQISGLARNLSAIGTAGLAAMGALAVGTAKIIADCTEEAANFENYMSDVVKVVDGLADATGKVSDQIFSGNGKSYADNYAAMKDTLLDLSTQIPYTQEDLTQLAAAAGQSGKTLEDLTGTDFLKDVAMWGTAMDVDAELAGDYAAKWEQAFTMSHDEVMELADVINWLGNNYATTAAEIADSVNASASMGQLAGVDPKATAAIAASMQAMGVDSGRVGTTIKRIYTNITKGSSATAAQQAAFAKIGYSAEEIAAAMQSVDETGNKQGIQTLLNVFQAINDLPETEKLPTLNALFGQWAIEGGAKVTQNLDLLEGMLAAIEDESAWSGSMEKEFLIKATTPEAIETMLESSKTALQIELGDAFLPAKKELNIALIEFLDNLRENVPELEQLAGTLGELASNGVEKLGEAIKTALPYIQKGLDYLANNGPQVAETLGKIASAFVGMKLAPNIEKLLSGAGNLLLGSTGSSGKRSGGLLGSITSLFKDGQKSGSAASSLLSAFSGASSSNGLLKTLSTTVSSLISGNGIKGTTDLLSAAAGTPGLISGYTSAGSAAKNAISGSKAVQYFGSIFSSAGDLGTTLGNTKAGGAIGGALNKLTLPLRKGIAGVGTAATIQGSIFQQGLSGLLGKAGGILGGILGGITSSGPGKAIGGALGSLGSIASSGAGVLSSVWSPVASEFGSIFSGVAPVIGAISGIIAVVSILGDNLDGIRTIIGNVFGDKGLTVFDSFRGKLETVSEAINGLFAEGGVANALAPLRDDVTNLFGTDAGAAFDGLTTILQSVMGVVGQIVSFANTTVKPIITDVFNFITQTVVPIILQTFTAAAPYIAGVVSGLGSAIMTGMQIIGSAIQAVLPVVEQIISVIMTVGSVVIPAVMAAFGAFAQGIGDLMTSIQGVFDGLITFITGVFTGNWSSAWEGIKDVFGSAFDALITLCKTPLNAVISLINTAISGINKLGITIPEWVPVIGGNSFSINIPEIPMLAKGGFTDGVSIAGEAGTEAVISFQNGVRAQNIATWAQAGRMLGVSAEQALQSVSGGNVVELKQVGGGQKEERSGGDIVFAPQIVIQGNADRDIVEEALEQARERFEQWYEQMMRQKARTCY